MMNIPRILLVDDDLGDVELSSEFLHAGEIPIQLATVSDGIEATSFLKGADSNPEGFRPNLIILDLNMPRKDGRELLLELKSDPQFRAIPVVVFTTSDAPEDVSRTYALGGNAFVTKPASLGEFAEAISQIKNFWLGLAQLS